jgi:hypothetical protein
MPAVKDTVRLIGRVGVKLSNPAAAGGFKGVALTDGLLGHGENRLVVDFQTLELPAQKIAVLEGHEPTRIGGYTTAWTKADGRVFVEGTFINSGTASRIRKMAADGFPWRLSVGLGVGSYGDVFPGKTADVNGQTINGPVVVLHNAVIQELSFVPVPRDTQTEVTVFGRGSVKLSEADLQRRRAVINSALAEFEANRGELSLWASTAQQWVDLCLAGEQMELLSDSEAVEFGGHDGRQSYYAVD